MPISDTAANRIGRQRQLVQKDQDRLTSFLRQFRGAQMAGSTSALASYASMIESAANDLLANATRLHRMKLEADHADTLDRAGVSA